nr:integrase, catalytic region, zinc finger, CCHC-type, peptidase aspartic, catalytic [Tanacetum cinerariifolium]
HTQKEAATLRELVESERLLSPLNTSLAYACKYTRRIQELLMILQQTCPRITDLGINLVAVTPKNQTKQVVFRWRGGSGGGSTVVAAGRVRESGIDERIDRETSNLFGFAEKIQPEKFSGGGRRRRVVAGRQEAAAGGGGGWEIVHSDYLRHTQEQGTILKELVEQGKSQNPLNNSLDHALVMTPKNKDKRVRFTEPVTSLGNIKTASSSNLVSNKPMLSSTGVKPSTSASGSQPSGCPNCSLVFGLWLLQALDQRSLSAHQFHQQIFRSKDEALDFRIKFLKMIQVRLKVPVQRIRTDNGTEFVNQTLRKYYEQVGISLEMSIARSPQQNGVVERRNRTLIEAARTMLIYARASLFLWAEAMNHRNHDFDELTAMASEQSSSGPALHEMTLATISLGIMPNPTSSTPFVPPSRIDLDLLFQPLFDELLNPPPSVDHPAPEVIAPIAKVVAPEPAESTSSASSTTVDQDAPLPMDTPVVEKSKLDEDKEGKVVDLSHYREADHAGCQDTRRSTSGPALQEMIPGTISSGLVQNPSSSTSYVPPSRNDWDLLFQPVDNQDAEVIAPIAEVIPQVDDDSTGSPSSTAVDQDAPSPSKSLTPTEIQSLVILQDVRNDNLDIEVAHMGNDPLLGAPITEVASGQSSSTASPQSNVQP